MKTYISIIFIAFAGILSSCEDFVEVENYEGLPADNFITSVPNAQTALNGAYDALFGQNLYYFGIYYYMDFATSELQFRASDESVRPLVNFGYYDGSTFIAGYWKDLYTIVSRADDTCSKMYLLRNSGNVAESEIQSLDQMIGECNFLRAFAYFFLTRSFGDKLPSHPQYNPDELGVPVPDTLIVSREQYKIPRKTLGQCWNKIIHDFETAYNLLPASWPGNKLGAATKGAAAGYLGQVYMYMKDYGKAKEWFEKAMQAGNQTGGEYALTQNYAWNFDYNHENNSESIFEVQTQMVNNDYTALASYLWRRLGPDGKGYGMVQASQQYVDKFNGGYLLTQNTYNDIQANPSKYIAQANPRRALKLVAELGYQQAIDVKVNSREEFFNLYIGDWSDLAAQINARMAADGVKNFDITTDDAFWGTVDSRYVIILATASEKDNDPRMYDSFYVPGRDSIALDWAGTQVETYKHNYYGFKKYVPYNAVESWAGQKPEPLPGIDGGNNINQRIFRLADLYLQYAEACYQTGDSGTAIKYLNKIRRRAWSLPFDDASLTTSVSMDFPAETDSGDFMKALIAEREKELCLEGVLWFDYLRWNKAGELFANRGFDPKKHHRLPVPLTERQIIGMNTLVQNSGY